MQGMEIPPPIHESRGSCSGWQTGDTSRFGTAPRNLATAGTGIDWELHLLIHANLFILPI